MTDRARIWDGTTWQEVEMEAFFAFPNARRVQHIERGTVVFSRDGERRDAWAVLAERRAKAPARPPPIPQSTDARAITRPMRRVKR